MFFLKRLAYVWHVLVFCTQHHKLLMGPQLTIAAAGVDRNVLVWDIRQPKAHVGRWNQAHKHEVTHLVLLPHAPTHAVVGGVDYEVCAGCARFCSVGDCVALCRWRAERGTWRLVMEAKLLHSQGGLWGSSTPTQGTAVTSGWGFGQTHGALV